MTDKKEKTPKQKSISERERAETVARAIMAQQPQLSKTAPRKEKLAWDQTPTLPSMLINSLQFIRMVNTYLSNWNIS